MKKLHLIVILALVLSACQGNKTQKASEVRIQKTITATDSAVATNEAQAHLGKMTYL